MDDSLHWKKNFLPPISASLALVKVTGDCINVVPAIILFVVYRPSAEKADFRSDFA